jgi:hypothetical protein
MGITRKPTERIVQDNKNEEDGRSLLGFEANLKIYI